VTIALLAYVHVPGLCQGGLAWWAPWRRRWTVGRLDLLSMGPGSAPTAGMVRPRMGAPARPPAMVQLPLPPAPIAAEWVALAVPPGPHGPGTTMPAWWARPLEGPLRGAVLVLPEVFGVNAWVRSVADRLASQGFAALAISTFSRTAPDLELGYDGPGLELGRQHRDQVTAAQLLADGAAAAAWLQQRHGVKGVGCVGFCFGGHLALLAATLPALRVTCDFYGARVASVRPGGGPPSLEEVPRIPGRLWCFCGDADPLIPQEEIDAIERALSAANGGVPARDPAARHRLFVLPGAGHGYLCEQRGDFQPAAAQQGWGAMLELFGASLEGGISPEGDARVRGGAPS